MYNDWVIKRFRKVHLDFHTAPFLPGVGKSFDAALGLPKQSKRRFLWHSENCYEIVKGRKGQKSSQVDAHP